MKSFDITGMSCAACCARVEKAVTGVNGVENCSVNLLTNSMTVKGKAADADIINAVKNAGYGASLRGAKKEEAIVNNEENTLKIRLIMSFFFLTVLMYISMGHVMWGWYLPGLFSENPLNVGLAQLILTVIILIINQKFFISGFKGFANKAPNMDSLVALGSGASLIYSIYGLFAMSEAVVKGDIVRAEHFLHDFYFESAAMIVTLITFGKMLEARSKGKTTDAIEKLIKMKPKTATVIRDGIETEINAEDLIVGDIFAVKPGESIPADGIVLEGESAVNESALTGESIPSDKKVGDKVASATINTSGYLVCRAERVGENTALGEIIKLVTEASASKAPVAKIADKVSGVFVPTVLIIAFITTVIWILLGQTFGFSLSRGISVLVISCPCALGLATPVAIMVGSGKGAKNGILYKNATALEEAGKCRIIALDKTGTVTNGEMKVTDIYAAGNEDELLESLYSVESKSEHPLAKAISEYAKEKNIAKRDVTDFEALSGNGVVGKLDDSYIKCGKEDFIFTKDEISEEIKGVSDSLRKEGKTLIYVKKNDLLLGLVAIADTIKEDSEEAIKALKNMGLKVVMLTGDNEITAKAIALGTEISDVRANLLPQNKESVIRELKAEGKVMMVGDGINDAPALTTSDIGVAIGHGTDIAIESADIVLMKSNLKDVARLITLSRATLANIHGNLFWAFFYNVLGIPIAAGALSWEGLTLSPMLGALFMSLSSFFVVSNALRLNLTDLDKIKKIKNLKKEKKQMEKTIKIEGMMCQHCSGRVKKCLEELPGVKEAIVSHEDGTAKVILEKEISYEILKKTIEEQGYKVIE